MKRILRFLSASILLLTPLAAPAAKAFATGGFSVVSGYVSQEQGNGFPVQFITVLVGCGPLTYDATTGLPKEVIATSVTTTTDINGSYTASLPSSQCGAGDRLYIKASFDGLTYDDGMGFINGEYSEGSDTFYNNTGYLGSAPIIQMPSSLSYSWPMGFGNVNIPALPAAPTNLTVSSASQPSLSWSPVTATQGSILYAVYRNGVYIGHTTTTSYTDTSASTMSGNTYTVSAVQGPMNVPFYNYVESAGSNTATAVSNPTPPTIGTPSWSANPITQGQTTNLSVPASSAQSSVTGGEYYIGTTDPGNGNGTVMTYDGTNLNASVGANLTPGTYQVNIRAKDAAGNWSNIATTSLVVKSPIISPTITSAANSSTGMRVPYNFTITTTGTPTSTITETGTLPTGVTFTDNGDGTAKLSGMAAAETAGSYPIVIAADNGSGSPAMQNLTLTVTTDTSAPAITSSSSDTETFGVPFSLTVNTTGFPAPSLSKAGALPAGVTFTDNGDGTATIAGTPDASAIGTYTVTITASSSTGVATQSFTLHILKAPTIKNIPNRTINTGKTFSMTIKANGSPIPSLTESGDLPTGVTFTDNGDGTATIAGAPASGSEGTYSITVTATNQLGSTNQTFDLKVS